MNVSVSGLSLGQCIEDSVERTGVPVEKFGDLPEKMAEHLTRARSDNTNIKYLSYFQKWEQFIISKGGDAIPASPVHVALYLTDQIDRRCSFSVISSSVYSIKWMHSLKGLPDPIENAFVKNVQGSAKRTFLTSS